MELCHGGFDNVVTLFGKAAPLKYPSIARVDAYWEGLRAGRLMPERSEVDPRGIGTALEHSFLLERVAPGICRVRISGMHMRDLLGMEVRGMPLTAFFTPDSRDRISKALERVISGPQVADITLTSPAGIGKPALTARLFLAPLSNSGRGSARVLGCLESHGEIGRNPRRFTVEQVQMRRIVATAKPQVQAPALPGKPLARPAQAHGFNEPRATFDHAPKAPEATVEKPYLRLVENKD